MSTVAITGRDTVNHRTQLQFDASWDNSWRDFVNHDSLWVFAKYRTVNTGAGDGKWRHATLTQTATVAPAGFNVEVAADGKGAFISRSGNGSGTTTATNVLLGWAYGGDAESSAGGDVVDDTDSIEIQVFAVEMVHVPQAAFQVGDASTTEGLSNFNRADDPAIPFTITSEAAITLGGTSAANLGATGSQSANDDDFTTVTVQTLPAAYPKGYNAFYCMKYEITQEQYVQFLNTLDRTAQENRVAAIIAGQYALSNNASVTNRNGVRCPNAIPAAPATVTFGNDFDSDGVFGEFDDGQCIACNYLGWDDVGAFLDWAALRPMTELEFEKACRGDQVPVTLEHANGFVTLGGPNAPTNEGRPDEYFQLNPTGGFFLMSGPYRVGILATGSSTRKLANAGYYGALELTWNVLEQCVGLGSAAGRAFTGINGDGALDASGNFNVASWPSSAAAGPGARGGGGNLGSHYLYTVSHRGFPSVPAARSTFAGGRGVRIHP